MNFGLLPEPRQAVISVSELNRRARILLEQTLPLLWVRGEISNFKRYDSGHWYFVLKDAGAQVRCVMFRQRNQLLNWAPQDGMQVEVRALVTLYEARGEFQLNVETMQRSGLGLLYEAFERLKARLEREGLFDSARKRALPPFPRAIGIVTSLAAAALSDVLTTLARRMPAIPVILYPTPVQGEGAAESIAQAIRTAGERGECDVLILCRGGGSLEDLWAFNEEVVARAIYACPLPVVTGVGHETDFTIADFVADARAPTPTAAAELASPNRQELLSRVGALRARIERTMGRFLEARMQHLDFLSRRLTHPGQRLRDRSERLMHLRQRLRSAWLRGNEARQWRVQDLGHRLAARRPDGAGLARRQREVAVRLGNALNRALEDARARIDRLRAHLAHLNPHAVLERGYSIAENAKGAIVRDSREIKVGEELKITFARGSASSLVTRKE